MNSNNQKILKQFNEITKSGKNTKILCRPSKFVKTINKIGKGEYGTVFRGKLSNKSIVYKVLDYDKMIRANGTSYNTGDLAQVEFDVSKKLINKGIKNVPKVYKIHACHKGNGNNTVTAPRYEANSKKKRVATILYSEFIDGEDLKNKLAKLNREQCISLLVQTIYSLYKIHDEFPSFRHHDLHLGNIMIKEVPKRSIHCEIPSTYTPPNNSLFNKRTGDKVDFKFDNAGIEVVLIDFGLSHIPEPGVSISNPMVLLPEKNTRGKGLMKGHGIFKGSDQCYDVHFFLNSLYISSKHFPPSYVGPGMIAEFVKNGLGLDSKFFDGNSDAIRNSRLRYNYKGIGIPNYNTLLNTIHEKLIKQTIQPISVKGNTLTQRHIRATTTTKRAPVELVRAANSSKPTNTQKTREQRDKEAVQTLKFGQMAKGIVPRRRPGIVTARNKKPQTRNKNLQEIRQRLNTTLKGGGVNQIPQTRNKNLQEIRQRLNTTLKGGGVNQIPQTRNKNLQGIRRGLKTTLKGRGVNKTLNRVKTSNSYKPGAYIHNNNKKSSNNNKSNNKNTAGSVKTGTPKSIVHTPKSKTRSNNRSN